MNCVALFAICLTLACVAANAQQQEDRGISVPATLSANGLYTHTWPPGEGYRITSTSAGLRGVVSPSFMLGTHWFVYFAVDAHSPSYFSYKTGSDFNLMQGFLGYTVTKRSMTLLVKAGQLSSAFGSFPLEYDEAKTPFPNAPPVYLTPLPIRPDQRPCGVKDLVSQDYAGEINFYCGGSQADGYGLLPVTLYGLPGLEAQLSAGRFDARLQITNSSPAYPQPIWSANQSPQWTAGSGYSPGFGLRVGMSGFRGVYTAVGLDAQWALGRWSAEAEWQRFRFALPGFVVSPTERAGYAQLKAIISPRTFFAARFSSLNYGRVQDLSGVAANTFTSAQQMYEFAFGYRPNRYQLLKTGFAWANRNPWYAVGWYWPRQQTTGVQVQLVTTLPTFSRAFR
jgi:hypothetical protein